MKIAFSRALALLLVLGATGFPLVAQEAGDIEGEIEALKKGQEAIQKELADIKKLIQARPAAPARPAGPNVAGKVFDIGANPVKGEQTAKLTLVEFTDYQ
ncbi:MAG: hypothetical protein OEM62_10635 [Acidobacteriota bacterium]|nr:hypothetical protein [Acidobacteriota bacterium]